jgi:hypothetical protein
MLYNDTIYFMEGKNMLGLLLILSTVVAWILGHIYAIIVICDAISEYM